MLLKDYYNPSDQEKEAAFREMYYFVQEFTPTGKFLVWLICRLMGDGLYANIAQKMHRETMSTLQNISCGMHSEFFQRKRIERARRRSDARGFVQAEVVE